MAIVMHRHVLASASPDGLVHIQTRELQVNESSVFIFYSFQVQSAPICAPTENMDKTAVKRANVTSKQHVITWTERARVPRVSLASSVIKVIYNG